MQNTGYGMPAPNGAPMQAQQQDVRPTQAQQQQQPGMPQNMMGVNPAMMQQLQMNPMMMFALMQMQQQQQGGVIPQGAPQQQAPHNHQQQPHPHTHQPQQAPHNHQQQGTAKPMPYGSRPNAGAAAFYPKNHVASNAAPAAMPTAAPVAVQNGVAGAGSSPFDMLNFGRNGNTANEYNSNQENNFGGRNLKRVDWHQHSLATFEKNFYKPHPAALARSAQEIHELAQSQQITCEGLQCHPVCTFEESNFPPMILRTFASLGFEKPSSIQTWGWPAALSGHDMIGLAETGSGKTLAYLLPGLVHLTAQPALQPGDGPVMLVLAPTRELALQVQMECNKFARQIRLRTACIFGGASKLRQEQTLRQGVEVVVATPGRLIHFLEEQATNLRRVTYLVLDEADRMLDMGFEPQVRAICSQIRPDRQTLMWSATWPREIQQLARDLCQNQPIKISVGSEELRANPNIEQVVRVAATNFDRDTMIAALIQERFMQARQANAYANEDPRVLLFCETKKGCEYLARQLSRAGLPVKTLHGDKEQRERDAALNYFKQTGGLLIATDVAARGLDIKKVELVINYDCPKALDHYIHRIGRTGRAGQKGTAFTYLIRGNVEAVRMAKEIGRVMQEAGKPLGDELSAFLRENNINPSNLQQNFNVGNNNGRQMMHRGGNYGGNNGYHRHNNSYHHSNNYNGNGANDRFQNNRHNNFSREHHQQHQQRRPFTHNNNNANNAHHHIKRTGNQAAHNTDE